MPHRPSAISVWTSSDIWAAYFSPDPPWLLGNLFRRKQLALYQEHQVQPRRATNATRLTMVLEAKVFLGPPAELGSGLEIGKTQ